MYCSSVSALPFEAVYEGPFSIWNLGTIQEDSVRALCSPALAQRVSGMAMGPRIPQVSAVVAADCLGQAWLMLWGSQIISTWSRNEPQLQLDSHGLDGWQKSLSSSRCMVAPPPGRELFVEMFAFLTNKKLQNWCNQRSGIHGRHCGWKRRLDCFPKDTLSR